MKNLKKQVSALCVSIALTLSVLPMTVLGAENDAASVSFGESTQNYATIDDAWAAAIACETTAENKATVKLLADCKAENTLTDTDDYLVLDTNGKTLTTPDAQYPASTVACGIGVEGGSLEIIGNGKISGISSASFSRAILSVTGGAVYANGVTIHNTGANGSIAVRVNGGEFRLLDGYLLSNSEYALSADSGKVYLYSGKIESTGRLAMSANEHSLDVQICYSDKPLYFVDNDKDNNWALISSMWRVHLEDNVIADVEYSDNPDGSNSTTLKSVTEIAAEANSDRNYLKIQTYKQSNLFDTSSEDGFLDRIKTKGVTNISADAFTAVHFVDLADHDLTNVQYADYSASSDGSVKAWVDGTELYIGGYGKITAGSSLRYAFSKGKNINSITGIEMLDTSNVTNMSFMFNYCGAASTSFTLDLGNNFDTSNVTNMSSMFFCCGQGSPVFTLNLGNNFDTSKVTMMEHMFMCCGESSGVLTLDLGDKFDTSNVTSMTNMFTRCGKLSKVFTLDLGDKFYTSKVRSMSLLFSNCGQQSEVFKELDLSSFTVSDKVGYLIGFAAYTPVTKFIFGKGWRNAVLPTKGLSSYGFAYSFSNKPTEIVGATKNLRSFDWASDKRTVTFTDNVTYTIIPQAETGGTVSGGGTVLDGESITLTATANDGYIFEGWYDDDTKVCTTEEFVIEDAADDKTYTAKFIKDITYYTISAEVGANGGGTVSGGGEAAEGESITLIAAANDGYTFEGWYDGDTKVCETAEFTVENVTANKTYTAKFTKNIVYYTISAEVGTDGGGTVSGGGEVAEGESITLTAAANDGYTFEGWYDGDTKVCETAEFIVENVTAEKTYTARFVKNQVEPDPEPENPEIPYLKWDGATLTLVKKQDTSCRVGIVYVGGATFDADNISWDELVAVGKGYANLNSSVGYAVYNNFTKRTPGTRGNYVAFVKYTKDDGTTTADYITYSVKDAVSFEIPALSYNVKTKTLKMTGSVSSNIGIAYVGDEEFNTSKVTWNDFIKAGKKYPDINGSGGYTKVLDTIDFTQTFETNGNYVAFIKYFDENLNKSLAKYYAFTVDDYNVQPTDAPFAVAEESKITLTANGFDVTKVTIVYIGSEDKYITNWNEFSAAAAKFTDINGKALNQQYANPKDGSSWNQDTTGWYAVYIRYIDEGKTCNSYYTVEVK